MFVARKESEMVTSAYGIERRALTIEYALLVIRAIK